ncbi:MAG: DUF4232 domain-containing protein [Streptosporangiaceae bacterium]
MAAVAAFVGTAVLAIALTRAPANSDASLSYGLSGRVCPTSGLEAWLGLGAASAASPGNAGPPAAYPGHVTYYTLEFTNVSKRACSLFGYPEVFAYRDSPAASGPIGGTAIRDTSIRPKPVMLEPGATAHAVLRVAGDTEPAACAEVTAEQLRITLPRQARPSLVPAHIPVCSQRGHASLSVQAIQARPGIPGRSMTH